MKELLKFITCGSVDDGKSTLIGRLLYDAKLVFTDQISALKRDSVNSTNEVKLDYSLLLDGLAIEREQGITIDVAYRYFSTDKRSFIVADCPGHNQYTRNMAVGASFANLAIVLVDATKGLTEQTQRHIRICSLLGIEHFVFSINKIDLANYNKSIFEKLNKDVLELMENIKYSSLTSIPVSALMGDNIVTKSKKMSWYEGETLLSYIENLVLNYKIHKNNFRMSIQRVNRLSTGKRGYQGQVRGQNIKIGDEVFVLPSGEVSKIKSIYVMDKCVNVAYENQPITIEFDNDIDVSRGNVVTTRMDLTVSNKVNASVIWMDNEELNYTKSYWLKCGTKTVSCELSLIKYVVDVTTGDKIKSTMVKRNDIACCEFILNGEIVYDTFANDQTFGCFILIDRISNATSACGVIEDSRDFPNDNITNKLSSKYYHEINNKSPLTLWLTGLSGAGKSTIATELKKIFDHLDFNTVLIDGDIVRDGLNKNLSYSAKDRNENIRRVAELAKLINMSGISVLVSTISPYKKGRELAKNIVGPPFKLLYINTDINICEKRDPKGLYKKARRGEINKFTGITDIYECPTDYDFIVNTENISIDATIDEILKLLTV